MVHTIATNHHTPTPLANLTPALIAHPHILPVSRLPPQCTLDYVSGNGQGYDSSNATCWSCKQQSFNQGINQATCKWCSGVRLP